VGLHSGPSSGVIARAPRDVVLLERAKRDLMDVQAVERRLLVDAIDGLSQDALPRGVEGVHGRFRDHLRLRVGRFRLLYRMEDEVLEVVAVMSA
jgi:mRNA-degrading endonuclease RelE of RelBE toxin-antitoxin system